ncbi:MAG: bacteriohemerythrin [Lentisphaeria bacterium]|nr:bacteriohemerythrin [Lentisphaeria bacterium]
MSVYSLTEETLTGIPAIDEQHQEWLTHLDAVLTIAERDEPIEEVARTLKFLVAYTVEHFSTEETCMVHHHYAGYAAHKAAHERLVQSLLDLLDTYQRHGTVGTVTDGLKTFMEGWFADHIQKMDKALALFLQENGFSDL